FVGGAARNPLLASFASLIALLLWFNLSAQVILIAASFIVTKHLEDHDRVRERFGARTLAQLRVRHTEDLTHIAARDLQSARDALARERENRTSAVSTV
ncbi:MAG: YihY/virulence factor BrkB family protein, partial [Microbacterium sp.]